MDRLLELLRLHSFEKKRVVLASGRESDFFIDVKQTALLAEGHVLVGARLLAAIDAFEERPLAVAGVALGGCSLASSVAYASFVAGAPLDAIYVRKGVKDHGSRRRFEGGSHLPEGAMVVMLEDVVTTGQSTLDAIGQLLEAGYRVGGVIAVVDRREGGAQRIAEAGHRLVAVYGREDFLGGEA